MLASCRVAKEPGAALWTLANTASEKDELPGRAAHRGPVVLTVEMKVKRYRIPTPEPADVRPVGHWNHPGDFLMQDDRFLGSLCYQLNSAPLPTPPPRPCNSYVETLTLHMTVF